MKRAWKVLVELVKMNTVEAPLAWSFLATFALFSGMIFAAHIFPVVEIILLVVFCLLGVVILCISLYGAFDYIHWCIKSAIGRVDSK